MQRILASVLVIIGLAPGAVGALEHHDLLTVGPHWLVEHRNDENVVIVDTREPEAYATLHVAGAVSLPVSATFSEGPRADLLASLAQFRRLMRTSGVRNGDHIVLYDDGTFVDAARVFWALEVYGHRKVSILDVGFPLWLRDGLPVSTEVARRAPSRYLPTINPTRLATKLTTRLAIKREDAVVIDARTEAEYAGRKSIARRYGHIPTARSVPGQTLIADDNPQLRSLDELAALFGEIPRDKKVVAYCNKGKASALVYFALRNLGYDVATYDGSWYEWGNDASLPIEQETVH